MELISLQSAYIAKPGPYEYSLADIIGVEVIDRCIRANAQMQQSLTISRCDFQPIQMEDKTVNTKFFFFCTELHKFCNYNQNVQGCCYIALHLLL
jgi:hypothetical protein